MNNFLKRVMPEVLCLIAACRVQFFLIVSLVATIGVILIVHYSPNGIPDLSELGIRVIVFVLGVAFYGSIWLFVRGIAK